MFHVEHAQDMDKPQQLQIQQTNWTGHLQWPLNKAISGRINKKVKCRV